MLGNQPRPLGTSPLSGSASDGSATVGGYPTGLPARLAPVVVFVLSLVIYVRTLLPGVAFDDWGEMQSIPHLLGIAHPTGYPTNILLSWLFELLPIGSIAYRANLFAAVCIAVAIAALCASAIRLGVRPAIAATAAVATAVVGTIWASATAARSDALHLALFALILERTLAWSDSHRPRDLTIGGLLIGLAMGNHLLTAFSASFLALFALWDGRQTLLDHKRVIAFPVLAGLAGISVYLYIPLAASLNPPLSYNHPTTWNAFWFLVLGQQFSGQYDSIFSLNSLGNIVHLLPQLWQLVGDRAFGLMPIAGLVGFGILVVRRPALGLALIGMLVVGLDIWATYNNGRLEHYLDVPWLILGLGMAITFEAFARAVKRWLLRPADELGGPVAATGAAALALLLIVSNFPVNDRSSDNGGQVFVDQVFSSLPPDAVILSWWGPSTALWYGHFVEGLRPDVTVVDDSNIVYEGWGTRENRMAAVICTRPVYLLPFSDVEANEARAQFVLQSDLAVVIGAGGPTAQFPEQVYHVLPKPGTCPTPTP